MKFLIVVQDLRVYGTSEGIVSRSFIARLRESHPHALIDVIYIRNFKSEDHLDILPVNSLKVFEVSRKIPFFIKWINWIYWRITNRSLNEIYLINKYRVLLKQVEFIQYDHIFIRSAGQGFEIILACKDLPILKKSIINFHDPYPVFWDPGSGHSLNGLEICRLKQMNKIVGQAKNCITPSELLSQDLQYLFGSKKKFFTLPHQYDRKVFKLKQNLTGVKKKNKKVVISYHGAVQLKRNLDILLDAYIEITQEDLTVKNNSEFILRIRGSECDRLKLKYIGYSNIIFEDSIVFSAAAYEQEFETDILIILENCSFYSNILVGKAPFIASLNKAFLCLSPITSEMRRLLKEDNYIAKCNDKGEIKEKLKMLILNSSNEIKVDESFKKYFSRENFHLKLNNILMEHNAQNNLS